MFIVLQVQKIEKKYFDCTKELAKEFLKENVEVVYGGGGGGINGSSC